MTHYDEFGVPPTASAEEIQKAHRGLARLLHPDQIQDAALRASAESQLKRLNAMYSVLMDPVQRRHYDKHIVRFGGVADPVELKRLAAPANPHRRSRSAAIALGFIAAIGAALGAGWGWGTLHPQPQVAAAIASQAVPAEIKVAEARPARPNETASDARELRRLLTQVIQERDSAVARLHSLHSPAPPPAVPRHLPTASAIPGLTQTASASHPAPIVPEFAVPAHTASAVATSSAPAPPTATAPARPLLASTWIYTPPAGLAAPTDQYAAAYIELLLIEHDGLLSGRYRARYSVPDRALSPDVEFYFEGAPPAAGGAERRYTWRGTAVLVRRAE